MVVEEKEETIEELNIKLHEALEKAKKRKISPEVVFGKPK